MSTPVGTLRRLGGVAAGVAIAAVLTACGSTSGTPSGTSATTAAPPTTASPSTGATAAPTSAPTAAPTSASGGGGVPNCATSELRGSLGPEDGAAGSVTTSVVLTNTGSRTCEVRGFPGVSYVTGDNGQQVGPPAVMSGARGGEVVLKPGARAEAPLQLVNVVNFDAGVCRPTPVRGLRVYPPGDTASLFIPRAGTGCAGTPPGDQMSVQTLKPA